MNKHSEEKKMITTGIIRWWRFFIVPIVIIVASDMFDSGRYSWWKVLILLFLCWLVYFLWKRRRLRFDSNNLYILRGKIETIVPLSKIISIKRSKTKVNGSRYWILIYIDEDGKKRKLRFDSDFDKEFHETVKDNNPEVVIWTHPHFNH